MVVICRMCTSGIPRLVALYPQRGLHIEATRREPGEYIVEGFYVIFLPYADDLRDLSPFMQNDVTKWPKGITHFVTNTQNCCTLYNILMLAKN